MTFPTDGFLALLLMATVRLSLAAALGIIVLRVLRIGMPVFHRWVWGAVLLQAIVIAPFLISLPVLAPQSSTLDINRLPNVSALSTSAPSVASRTDSEPSSSVSAVKNVNQLLVYAWFGGCLLTLLTLVVSQCAVIRMIRTSCMARSTWQRQLACVVERTRIRKRVRLRVHPTLGPLLARTFAGYSILVPRQTWDRLTGEQREAILLHELSHLQRGDVWKSLVMRCMASMHWFNPLAWWSVARFDEAAEWACDARVRQHGDRPASALAAALLQLSRPTPLVRLGVSNARGAHLGVRVRKLVDPLEQKETTMKKLLIVGFASSLLLVGFVRLQLTAQETKLSVGGGGMRANDIAKLVDSLQDSSEPSARELGEALASEAGQLVLQDQLSERASRDGRELRQDIVNVVLHEHFSIQNDRAQLIDTTDPIRAELIDAGATSIKDMKSLTEACRGIAEEIEGDDETTLLVKRFLTNETGLGYLYITALREQMRPGPAMFAESLGRALAVDSDGMYYIRPDAREKLSAIVETRPAAEKLAARLHRELKSWAKELAPDVELSKRVQSNASSPLFAAMLVAGQVFEQQRIEKGQVNEVLDSLDQMVVDTSSGLQIADHAREEISRVMEEFELIESRIDVVRPELAAMRSMIAGVDDLSRQFKELLGTDIAIVALASESEMAGASTEQLVRSILSEAFEESSGKLRLTSDPDTRENLSSHLQDALREFRAARRHAAPVRELAEMLEDPELASALKSVGGMLIFKQLAERKVAEAERAVFRQWKKETFEEAADGLTVRESARQGIKRFIEEVEQLNKGLSDNDF